MTVFKACFKIIKAYGVMLSAFFISFTFLGIMAGSSMAETTSTSFEGLHPTVGIVNRDGESSLLSSLEDYLSAYCDVRQLPDELEYLQDSVFAGDPDYILIIPQGFSEKISRGQTPELQKGGHQMNAKNYYVDMLVNQYVSVNLAYIKAGLTPSAAAQAALSELDKIAAAEMKSFTGKSSVPEDYRQYFVWSLYTFMLLVPLGINAISAAFKKNDLNQRNLCAPMSSRRQSSEIALGGLFLGIIVWILISAAGLINFASKLGGVDVRQILLLHLNSLVFMLVGLGLASVIASVVSSYMIANAASNMLSLIFAFLGGTFVPISMFGEGMKRAAMFIPNYWSINTIDSIVDMTGFGFEDLLPVLEGMALQLGFAVFFFCLSLALGKVFERKSPPAQTELEFA